MGLAWATGLDQGPEDWVTQAAADAPVNEPLTIEEAGRQVRMSASQIIASTEDLTDAITAARQIGETWMGRRFITQTVDWVRNRFPCGAISLPFANVTAIVSITYIDTAGATVTLAADQYRAVLPVGAKCARGRLEPAYGVTWPATRAVIGAVTIRMTAGYGPTGADVPAAIKTGMKALIAHWDRSREAVNVGNITSELPFGVKWAWWPFRTY